MSEVVLVFGASGFIGRNLTDRLTSDGRVVFGVTHSGAPVPGAARTIALERIGDLPALPADAIALHVANHRYDSQRFELVQSDVLTANLALNARIFQVCAERKITELRMASSVAVYHGALEVMDDAIPIDLNSPPHQSEAFYAWSKRSAEIMASLYAQRFGVNCISFRLSNPYGPYDSTDPRKAHVAPAFVMKALDANPVFSIRGDARVERDFVFVGDVVEAFMRSLEWTGRNDAYNLCTGRSWTLQDLAQTVMRVAGVDKPIEAGAPGAFGPVKRVSTSARICAALGMSFRDLAEGMAPTVDWYRREFKG